ncbi:MAG TPA: ATP-binding protein, partial [Candidatus Sulfotelmatobacter sp.]|nr:ATP-binding protein [Candidatus Sulfotelmatobacter sp.]
MLVIATIGRDAILICNVLGRVGISCAKCDSWEDLFAQIDFRAGAVIVAEEALTPGALEEFSQIIKRQPPWSDFPLLLLTTAGAVSTTTQRRRNMREPLGNVHLLERPVRPETLVSAVLSALRARRRQYEIRDNLQRQQAAEKALRESEKLAVAGRMAASIAHEINNPLAAITNLLYLCSTANSMLDVKNYLQIAQQEMARVTAITTHTLTFYRHAARPAPVKITGVLDSVLVLFHSRLNHAGIKVQKDYHDTEPVMGLSGELRQLLANLIANALDAMRSGGKLTVRVHNAQEFGNGARQGVRVVIADTGAGINPEMKSRIFDPFFTTKGQTGTGLGLWISAEIIQKHSGTVRVKSCV